MGSYVTAVYVRIIYTKARAHTFAFEKSTFPASPSAILFTCRYGIILNSQLRRMHIYIHPRRACNFIHFTRDPILRLIKVRNLRYIVSRARAERVESSRHPTPRLVHRINNTGCTRTRALRVFYICARESKLHR